MNHLGKALIVVLFSLFALFASAEATASKHPTYVLCKNRKIVRTLRVEDRSSGGCETVYTKAGIDRSIGSGFSKHSCFKFMDNVQDNLGKAGWTCKDISQSKISSSQEKAPE